MPVNPAFNRDEQEAEGVVIDPDTIGSIENTNLGYGDADTHGCWYRFRSSMRSKLTVKLFKSQEI